MLPLYAEAGIQEFWIANLRDNYLEVYRGPRPDGTYQETRVLQRGELKKLSEVKEEVAVN